MDTLGGGRAALWTLGAVAVIFAAAAAFAFSPIAGALLLGPIFAFTIFTRRPKLGFVVWMLSVATVPCWIGVNAGNFLPASLIGSLLALTCLFAGARWLPCKSDLCVVVLLTASAFGVFFGSSTGESSMSAFVSMFTLWVPGYLVGRFVCERAGISFVKFAVAVTFGAVGCLAIAEKLLSWHPFAGMAASNPLTGIWAPIQTRGGVDRSEWAFGHSIALGGALALSIPFVLSSSLKTKTKLLMLALILGGVGATLSRGAMLAAGLTLVLSLLLTRNVKQGHKVLLFFATGVLGAYTLVDFLAVSEDAGSEVTDSSGYRMSLFTRLVATLQPIGRSSAFQSGAGGEVQYGNYASIDNAFMAIGLGFGWIAMLVVAVPFVVMGIRFVTRRASFAETALLGQLPVITTVAMITQYQVFVWMVAGLAATLAAAKPSEFRKLDTLGQIAKVRDKATLDHVSP